MKSKLNYKGIISLIVTFVLILSAIVVPKVAVKTIAQSTNLITNGDFENGTTGWLVTPSTSSTQGTFSNVNAVQNSAHSINITGNAGYFVTGHTSTWLYQPVRLAAGEYTWQFHIDLYGTHNMVGAYTSLENIGKSAGLIVADTFAAQNDAGVTSTAFKKETNDYRIALGKGNSHYTVTYVFTLTEETEVYFAIRGNQGGYQYIDNMSLVKTVVDTANTELQNGDFENGLTGWSVTPTTSTTSGEGTLKNINAPENSAHVINITNNAGCFVTAHTSTWLYQPVKLAAGEYTWQFHIDLYGKNVMAGAYNSLDGIGKAANLIVADTFTAIKDDGSPSAAFKKDTNDYRFGGSQNNWNFTVTYVFTLTEETTVYFALRGNAGSYEYIDNMSLVKAVVDNTSTELQNGDFENGVTGWNVTPTTSNTSGEGTFTNVNAAQNSSHIINITNNAGCFVTAHTSTWLYQPVKLAAGEYTWQFHIDLYGKNVMAGAYNSLDGIGKAANLIVADTFTAIKDDGSPSAAFKKDTNDYRFGGSQNNWNFTVTYVFTLTEETTVYFALRGNAGSYEYIDNMTLKSDANTPSVNTTNYDFEDGKSDSVIFISNIEGLRGSTAVSEEYAHGGTKSLKSTAVADKNNTSSAQQYQGGRYSLPIKVEKNKFYKTTFWLRIDGDNAEDSVSFRVSNSANAPSYRNSIISTNSGINPSAEMTVNPATTEWKMNTVPSNGWLGLIQIMNTNTAASDDWVEISVKYASGDLEEVYLEFTNFYRKGTVFYLDDVVTVEVDSLLDDSLDYGFEKGGTGEIKFAVSGDNGLGSTTMRTDEDKHTGSYSLISTAVADSTVNGSYQGGTLAIPLKNLEKNKNYRLSFWTKIKGTDVNDMVAFRVSNAISATYKNSLISSNAEVFYSTNLTVSDANYKLGLISKPASGWAGYIGITNKNAGSDWIKISVEFSAGENDEIYLQFANFFKKGTTFYIDDIATEEIGDLRVPPVAEYDDENVVYHITFEEDVSVPLNTNGTPADHYFKTDKYAHTGKYSVYWDSNHNDGWNILYYTDKVGNVCHDPVLEPKTAYRFSVWVYSVGPKAQSTKFAYQYPGMQQTSVRTQKGDWEQIVIDFVTGEDQTSFPFKICSAFMRFGDTYQYIDDIKLEKLNSGIIAVDTPDNYCEAFFNKVQNGNFEKDIKGTVWDTDSLNIKRIKATEDDPSEEGAYYAHLTGDADYTIKLDLKSVYQYKFMFSYRTDKASNLKIGILDDKGNELKAAAGVDAKAMLTPSITDGEWHRMGYTILTPASGYVYLKISGTNLDIDLDEIAVYKSRLTYELDPNTYEGVVKIPTDDIPDFDIDSDLSVNTDFDIDLDTEFNTDIQTEADTYSDTDTSEKNDKSDNDKSKTEKESSPILFVVLAVLAAFLIVAAVIIILLKKRSKK